MATIFNLQQSLSAKRDVVISKYNELTAERFFDGCTLRQFMVEVMNACIINNIRSEKRLSSMLPYLMGDIYFRHSTVTGCDVVADKLHNNMPNQQWAAIV